MAESDGDSPKAVYRKLEDPRMSAEEMDERRRENVAYEYLCHLEEAKVWIEACVNEQLPLTTELEEGLRNGVFLAKLAHFMTPDKVPIKRIYDRDQARYKVRGLHFRHTDNINHYLRALEDIGLPKIFYPETTDIYDRKNMPKVIYCIHALSLYLFKLGRAPQIQDLYGKIKFTDEEISAMRRELEKYGIQMPAFSKIGGILANEMPVDEAALHAAVIAINEAIDRQIPEDTLDTLKISSAHLINIYPDLSDMYQQLLFDAKEIKAENARNKSLDPDSSYIPDVYDELLTQAEIQGNINKVNVYYALERVNEALDHADEELLLKCLQMPQLNLRDLQPSHSPFYLNTLLQIRDFKKNNNTADDIVLTREEIQQAVSAANLDADADYQRVLAVQKINEALDEGEPLKTYKALENPRAQIPTVMSPAAKLYHVEFCNIRDEKQAPLDYDEIVGGVQVLTAIAQINQAIDTGNASLTLQALYNPDAHIQDVESDCAEKYHQNLRNSKADKADLPCEMLTHFEIQSTVHTVNQQVVDEQDKIIAVGHINEAIDKASPLGTLQALTKPSARLKNLDENNASHYQNLLGRCKREKAKETDDPAAVLWYEEIQSTVDLANKHTEDGTRMSLSIKAINEALEEGDMEKLLENLQDQDTCLHSVTAGCAQSYLDKLAQFKTQKAKSGETGSGWMMNRTREGFKFYYNINDHQHAWERPDGVKKDHSMLTKEEIQTCISEVTAVYDRELLYQANEPFIIKMQALIRGYLARKRFSDRVNFMMKHLPAIMRLQCWWRMIKVRRAYLNRLRYLESCEEQARTIQAQYRMCKARNKYLQRVNYFKANEPAVIRIQAFMRSNWAKQDYKMLMHGDNPPVHIVRKFVHLLDLGDEDYAEEIELAKLRQQVVQEIRNNQKLENDLNNMDIKIGLLVRNRITIQDVVSQHKTLKQYKENSTSSLAKGLKALSKQSRERLEAYQHLFYLLQTNPTYLAKLIFEMPQSKTTKFMESVILTIYNYASNQREEYLLLKLFKTALKEEIRSKVDKMSDVVTGNPMVVKMIVSFNRNARGQSTLRDLLNPLVTEILQNKNLMINTNPVEVYKQWINQFETQTGKTSGLPYDVTIEQAMSHDEVREKIENSVKHLQQATDKFLQAILSSVDKIPYGMRYMAKVLKDAMHEKFPDAHEKDILKTVGNLIYYRYINSAIVAPDAFDIVDVSASKGLTNDQRRNLGSIAKILQFAASNKGFGGESAHLSSLNPYIMDSHNKFKKYFRTVCEVDEPEVKFNMDQYADVTRVTKPVIYISIAEIIETHKLLLEHQDAIAPDHNDTIHELLEDLGDVPDVESLIGDAGLDDQGTSKIQLAKTEISLTLSNKFEVPEDDQTDVTNLLLKTKRLVVDVIRCQRKGDNLVDILAIPASEEEEDVHQALIKRRERVDQRAASRKAKLVRQQSLLGDTRLPLDSMKVKIQANLDQLEKAGVITKRDKYQGIINSIVQDIRNQRIYRQNRKQEMVKLKQTLKSLSNKRSFYEEQIDYYNQYVKTCLDNLATKNINRKSGLFSHKGKSSIKYTAAKLHEKGVILEIEALPANQFKNVLFEINATEIPGTFEVNAKFMGLNMEKVQVVLQDLLQLQYEGVAVMKMFDKAKVNVNLLIFLLNKKFYGK